MEKWVIILIGAVLSGILYRMGGSANLNTKFRDWGCPLVALTVLSLVHTFSWWYVLSFFLMWGALSTYWKGDLPDCKWYHWALHGLGVGLSLLPYGIATNHICSVTVYAVCMALSYTIWSQLIKRAWLEEGGRGAFIVLLLALL